MSDKTQNKTKQLVLYEVLSEVDKGPSDQEPGAEPEVLCLFLVTR